MLLCAGVSGALLALSPHGLTGGPVLFRFLPFNSSSRIIAWSQVQNHLSSEFVSGKASMPAHIRTVLNAGLSTLPLHLHKL